MKALAYDGEHTIILASLSSYHIPDIILEEWWYPETPVTIVTGSRLIRDTIFVIFLFKESYKSWEVSSICNKNNKMKDWGGFKEGKIWFLVLNIFFAILVTKSW